MTNPVKTSAIIFEENQTKKIAIQNVYRKSLLIKNGTNDVIHIFAGAPTDVEAAIDLKPGQIWEPFVPPTDEIFVKTLKAGIVGITE